MHALSRFIEEQLEVNGWTQADLVRQSGLSKQHLSKMLADDRDRLPRLPTEATLLGLARGLRVPLNVVVLRAAQACGVPVDVTQVEVGSPRAMSTDQLLAEVRRRIELGGAGDGRDTASIGPADGPDNVRPLPERPSAPPIPKDVAAHIEDQPSEGRRRRKAQDDSATDV